MSELLKLYRDAQKPYEKFIQYCATAPVGPAIYYDMLLDRYSEADQIFVKRVLELEAENAALTARIAELEAAQKEALSLLPELERGHYYCDDCWYSCPKAVDGCCDERQGDECNCGADNYNALLAKIIGLLTSEVQE